MSLERPRLVLPLKVCTAHLLERPADLAADTLSSHHRAAERIMGNYDELEDEKRDEELRNELIGEYVLVNTPPGGGVACLVATALPSTTAVKVAALVATGDQSEPTAYLLQ